MLNGAKFIQKLTPGFKNHLSNFDNFRQAAESPKGWNSMGYFCPKNTFLQLKHYIRGIYLTLLSTTCVKIHQIPYVIFETISRFSRHNSSVLFLTRAFHTFSESSISKCKFSYFPLLVLKFIKFLMSFFKQRISFSSKFESLFSVMRGNYCVIF